MTLRLMDKPRIFELKRTKLLRSERERASTEAPVGTLTEGSGVMSHQVLIVEDDRDLAHLLKVNLEDLDCRVRLAHDGGSGLQLALNQAWDLIILDIMLPKIDGIEMCRRLRALSTYVPIIILTVRDSEVDRIIGLEVGADDYLTKPFSMRELQARVKAQFRRSEAARTECAAPEAGLAASAGNPVRAGELEIDADKRQVKLRGREVHLTAKEFDLLLHMASRPGMVFSRAQLLDRVWSYSYDGYEHTVNSHINRLRSKIEDDPVKPRYILTVWGVGYKFADR